MARVRICTACGQSNPAAEPFCECGTPLAGLPVTDETAASAPTATVRDVRRVLQLMFPWGGVTVSGRLPVGRDQAFSPLAGRLAGYDTVSRRHAELSVTAAGLAVRHLGENNPTYVNGRPLSTGETAELVDGDEVAFSRSVAATVRWTQA